MNKRTAAMLLLEMNDVFNGSMRAHLHIDDHLACGAETGLALTLKDFIELVDDELTETEAEFVKQLGEDYPGIEYGITMACPKCVEYCNTVLLTQIQQ